MMPRCCIESICVEGLMTGFNPGRPGDRHTCRRCGRIYELQPKWTLVAICCPKCKRTSYHPKDAEQGYCGNCHEFNGKVIQ